MLPANNYVSPNGDGKNDYFFIVSPEVYKNYELVICNDNGVVVFQKTAYDNTWTGDGLRAGVYYYTLLGGNKKYKGNIVLVK